MEGQGVREGYTVLEVSPGTEDIHFDLELKRNPGLDCTEFDFFNVFSGLDFDFIMTDTADYISYKPQMQIELSNPVTQQQLRLGDATPEQLKISITMPMIEQEKLPVFQDIMIHMTAHWASSVSADFELTSDIVF